MKLREKRAEGKENEVESINFCWLMEWNFSAAEGWAPSHNPQKERLTPREQLSLASLLSSATKSIKQKQWNLFDWICCWLAAQRLAAWCGASLIHSISRHSFVQFHQLNWFHWSTEFAFIPFLHSAHKLFFNLISLLIDWIPFALSFHPSIKRKKTSCGRKLILLSANS